jgi:hypothetical protein
VAPSPPWRRANAGELLAECTQKALAIAEKSAGKEFEGFNPVLLRSESAVSGEDEEIIDMMIDEEKKYLSELTRTANRLESGT